MEPTRQYRVAAAVRPVEDVEFDGLIDTLVTAGLEDQVRAAKPSPVVNGRMRMLHISAFIAHEGFNDNDDGFLAEELQQAVEERRLFESGYGGIIDFNHDLEPKGYWYAAEYLFDPKANKYGVLAHGAVWAWRFPQLADEMLAEQSRSGKVDVSMGVFTNRVEIVKIDGRDKALLHDPVFIGASLLNAKPADPNGNGIINEDPEPGTTESRKDELLQRAASLNEEKHMEEMLTQIMASLPTLGDEVATKVAAAVTAAVETQVAQVKAELEEKTSTLEQAAAEADARIAELTTEVAEKDLAIETATATVAELTEKNTALQARVDEFEAEQTKAAFAAMKEARLNELPEDVRARVAAKTPETRDALLTRWASQSDEDWKVTKEELSVVTVKPQGIVLPNFGMPKDNDNRINLDKHLI